MEVTALSADATIAQQDGVWKVGACLSITIRQEMKIFYLAHGTENIVYWTRSEERRVGKECRL